MPAQSKQFTGTLELKADRDNFYPFIVFIESFISETGINAEDKNKILLVAEEILVNIISYAYKEQPGTIKTEILCEENLITMRFIDGGVPFNALEAPHPDISLPLEERGIGGYGILIVKTIMDSIGYKYSGGKNHLTITKNFSHSLNSSVN